MWKWLIMPGPAKATLKVGCLGLALGMTDLLTEAEQTGRIACEDPHALLRVGNPALERAQRRGVSESAGDTDEGPVRSPNAILDPEGVDHRFREGSELGKAGVRGCDAKWRGKLDRRPALASQREHGLEARLIQSMLRLVDAEVIDQHADATAPQDWRRLNPLRIVREDLGVPSDRLEPRQVALRVRTPERIASVAHEIETDPDDTARGEVFERAIAALGIDDGDRLESLGMAGDRVEDGGVVVAVAAELHQQRMPHAMSVDHMAEHLARPHLAGLRPIARPVPCEGKAGGIDDMGVGIDDAQVGHGVRRAAFAGIEPPATITRVVAGSKSWIAERSSEIQVRSPGRSAVSRPTRAVNSSEVPSIVSRSSVSAPSGSTAATRTGMTG